MLAGYVIFILMMTILYREGKGTPGNNFDPALLFHRFGADAFSRKEIIFNVWLFIPFGALLGRLSRKPWILLIILGTTILIEGSQYLFHIGFCDICDVINNTLGGILGFLAVGAMGVKNNMNSQTI